MKKVIENIGKIIIENFFDFDKHEYEYNARLIERENGVYEPARANTSFHIEVGEHVIDCAASVHDGKLDYVEAVFESESLQNVEDALNEYLKENFDAQEFFTSVRDDIETRSEDEWTSHGFANEADYIRYRYA